jgi:cytochrome c553
MAAVQRNLAKLSEDDLKAIAAFLKSAPPVKSKVTRAPNSSPTS